MSQGQKKLYSRAWSRLSTKFDTNSCCTELCEVNWFDAYTNYEYRSGPKYRIASSELLGPLGPCFRSLGTLPIELVRYVPEHQEGLKQQPAQESA